MSMKTKNKKKKIFSIMNPTADSNVIVVGDFLMARAYKKAVGYFPVRLFDIKSSQTLVEIIDRLSEIGTAGNFRIIDELDPGLWISLRFESRGSFEISTDTVGTASAENAVIGVEFVLLNSHRRYRLGPKTPFDGATTTA
jgi:hypothetical protein